MFNRSILIFFVLVCNLFLEKSSFALPGGKVLFVQNQGQWNQKIQYQAQVGSHRVWLQSNRLTYELIHGASHPLAQVHALRFKEKPDSSRFLAHTYHVYFEGANPVLPLPDTKEEITRYNFYQGKDPSRWKSGVPSYSRVAYPKLYPGISLSLYGGDQFLKYDFELDAGQSGENISLRFEGVRNIQIEAGKLRIHTALGVVEEHIPRAYQLVEGVAKEVQCYYVLSGSRLGFRFKNPLDKRYPTVIDPLLNFFTYSGAFSDNWANTAVSDSEGNAYTAGTVYGGSFPTTTGAFDRSFNGNAGMGAYLTYDVGVLKFDSTGSRLLSCTFIGGSGAETPHSLAVDPENNLLIMGSTSSPNFPVTARAYQRNFFGGPVEYPFGYEDGFVLPTYTNGSDVFITKLNSSGQSLLASTYLGGSGTDGLMTVYENLVTNYGDQFRGDVLPDQDGMIYIATSTHSANFPSFPQFPSLKGNMDGIVVKMNSDLSNLIWSVNIGGAGEDAVYSVKFLGTGRLVVCGGTNSNDFPVTSGAFQTGKDPSSIDGFVTVLNKSSGSIQSATYSGTGAYDQAYLVDTDKEGGIFIFGQTQGQMPRTAGTFGDDRGGQFLQKFSSDLRTRFWSATFGKRPFQPNIVPTGLLVDSCERIYIAGWGGRVNYEGAGFSGGYTAGLPVTNDAFQRFSIDSSDFYFMILGKDARTLEFGSYLGAPSGRGEHVDGGTSRFDRKGVITQAVCGCKDGNNQYYRGTPNAYQPLINSGNCNNGVMKINLLDLKVKFDFAGTLRCPADLTLTNSSENGEVYTWFFGNGDSLQSNERVINYRYNSPGKYQIKLKAVNPRTCRYQAVAEDSILIPSPFELPSAFQTDSFCVGDTLRPSFEQLAPYSVFWTPQNYLSSATSYQPVIVPQGSLRYSIRVSDINGCQVPVSYELKNRKINLGFGKEITYKPCEGSYRVRLFSNRDSSERYFWELGDGETATGPEVVKIYTQNGKFPIRLNGVKGSCEENAIDTLVLSDRKVSIVPSFTFSRQFEGCDQPFLIFTNTTQSAQAFIWDFGDGVKSSEVNPRHRFEKPGSYVVRLEAYKDDCKEVYTKTLQIEEDFKIPSLITFNKDGKNEAFAIQGIQPGWGLDIFNRWGHRIYKTDAYQNDWKPVGVQEGVYFYSIRFPEGSQCNSWFQVLRQ